MTALAVEVARWTHPRSFLTAARPQGTTVQLARSLAQAALPDAPGVAANDYQELMS